MRRATLERITGAAALAALAGALVAVSVVGDFNPFLPRNRIHVLFDDVNFAGKGTVVRAGGMHIGLVRDLELRDDGVLATLEVNRDTSVHPGYRILVRALTTLGGRYVDVRRGDRGLPPLQSSPARPLSGRVEPELLKGFAAIGREVGPHLAGAVENVRDSIRKLDEAQGTLGKLLSDASLQESLGRSLARLELASATVRRMSAKAEEGTGTLGRLAREPRFERALAGARARLGAIADRVRSGEGPLGALVAGEAVPAALERARERLVAVAEALFGPEGGPGGEPGLFHARRMDRIRENARATAEAISTVLDRFRESEGAVAFLASDEARERIERMRANMERFSSRPPGSTVGRLAIDPALASDVERALRDWSESGADSGDVPPVTPSLIGIFRGLPGSED